VTLSDNGGTANGGVDTSPAQTFTITVTAVNDAPVLMVPDTQRVDENKALKFTVSAKDLDVGQTVTLSATGLPKDAKFDSLTGTFTWTPSFSQSGSYTVAFTAKDNGSPSLNDTKTVSIRVNEILPEDFSGDGVVNFDDFFMFAEAFGKKATNGNAKFDLDGDGEIGFGDFFMFAGVFGKKATT